MSHHRHPHGYTKVRGRVARRPAHVNDESGHHKAHLDAWKGLALDAYHHAADHPNVVLVPVAAAIRAMAEHPSRGMGLVYWRNADHDHWENNELYDGFFRLPLSCFEVVGHDAERQTKPEEMVI